MRHRRLAVLGLGALVSVGALQLWEAPVAEACGGFFMPSDTAEKRPSLSREKVLLIHDAKRGKQHFIREVAFERAIKPFGFVVPTPTRPEVEPVKKQPYSNLRAAFFFQRSKGRGMRGAGSGGGADGGGGVTVLEKKKVGSFTAFVLAASDPKALAKWLADNNLVSTKEADAWLAHYVKAGFFYVAMRYDPPKRRKNPGAVEAETIRISFDSPLPFYPYLEPDAPELDRNARLMELWYVGTEEVVPVALERDRWVRPLHEGQAHDKARKQLEEVLEDEIETLLPEGELVVQTFQDQKFSRKGFGDIVFAFREKHDATPALIRTLEPMFGILDPALVKEAK